METKSFLAACLIFIGLKGAGQGIEFDTAHSWSEVQAKAKLENKFIFVDAYATWCGPCRDMSEDVFTQPAVGSFINSNFIAFKVQMDKTNTDEEQIKSWFNDAEKIAKQGQITAYPALLFYSPEGELVHKSIGYKEVEALISEAKKALDTSKQYFTLMRKFKSGLMDTAEIKSFARQVKKDGDKATAAQIAQGYIKLIPKNALYQRDNLAFIGDYINSSEDPNFQIFLKNRKRVNKILGKNYAENKVMGLAAAEEIVPYEDQENPDWISLEKRMISKYGNLGRERLLGHQLLHYWRKQEWQKFGIYYQMYFDYAVPNERSFLSINAMSWAIFEHVTDPKILKYAVKIMKYDIEKFDGMDPAAIDTYANLLYKTGNDKQAIKYEGIAAQLSNGDPVYVETLQEMKRGVPTW